MRNVLKKLIMILSLSAVLVVGLSFANALAANQKPNLTVYLGSFDIGPFGSWASEPCRVTAKNGKVTLAVSLTDGAGGYYVQRRTTDGGWKNTTLIRYEIPSDTRYRETTINGLQGAEYRIKVSPSLFGMSGQVYCY